MPQGIKLTILTILLLVTAIIAGVAGYIIGSTTVTGPGITAPTPITTPTPPQITWRMAAHVPAGDPRYKINLYFVNLVKNLTNGRLIIELHPGGELFPIPQTFDAVSRGVVEMAEVFLGYWVAEDPVMALGASIPGPIRSPDEILYLYKKVEPILRKHIEARGVILIGPLAFTPVEVFMSRKPVFSLRDIKGLLVRSVGISAKIYEALGAKVVAISPAEVFHALQLGTIDALEYGEYGGNYLMGFHELCKYVLEPPPGYSIHSQTYMDNFLIVNPDAWRKLPDDLKRAILVAVNATWRYAVELMYHWGYLEARELWKKAGAVITTISPEEARLVINISARIFTDLAKQSEDAKNFVITMISVWRDLGYSEWADAVSLALRKAGII
jgi:TRAP-type mannitol/chloroaromatic compound transport system substrate-binding protein